MQIERDFRRYFGHILHTQNVENYFTDIGNASISQVQKSRYKHCPKMFSMVQNFFLYLSKFVYKYQSGLIQPSKHNKVQLAKLTKLCHETRFIQYFLCYYAEFQCCAPLYFFANIPLLFELNLHAQQRLSVTFSHI